MTKRPTKPAKGVPMPKPCRYFECCWIEDIYGVLIPWARAIHWTVDGIDIEAFVKEHAAVRKWLANPATPKGVRR